MSKKMHRSKSVLNGRAKTSEITPEEMFRLSKRDTTWGIEGYNIPKHYFDYKYEIWKKKRVDIKNGVVERKWPPDDWKPDKNNTTRIPPIRRTYLNDIEDWCHSFYNENRAKDIIDKNPDIIKDYVKKIEKDKTKRDQFLKHEKEVETLKKKIAEYIPEHKIDGINKVKSSVKEDNKKKELTYVQKMKAKYIKGKEIFPRCDRITVLDEAKYLGEQVPFYKTPADENGKINKKKLFWPNKIITLHKSPSWRICKPFGKNENEKAVKEMLKEKVDNYLQSKNMKKSDLNYQIRDAFNKTAYHGKLYMKIEKDTDWKNEEHHKKAEEDHPRKSPAPNQYWRVPKKSSSSKNVSQDDVDANGNKIYYMDRAKTDRRICKSTMRKCIY